MEIFKLSATEMAEKLRSKELSATEITKASLAHIEAVEPQVDAIEEEPLDSSTSETTRIA
jgi:Asp-tRNA(Asn)/Glu-tRNA(Gln) amidotransferase A subunit family amidase